jgi:hypothetical protein
LTDREIGWESAGRRAERPKMKKRSAVGADPRAEVVSTVSPGSVSLLRAWAVPAAICTVLIAALTIASPFAGGVVGLAGVAYLATTLAIVIGLVIVRRLRRRPPRPQVAVLTAAWTAAWMLGIVTFGLVSLVLEVLPDNSGSAPGEGFVLSPVFWLLSFPTLLVFLLTAIIHPGSRPQKSREAGSTETLTAPRLRRT